MSSEAVDIYVDLVRHHESAMLVTDGDVEVWIPYSEIDSGSELTQESEEGDSGNLTIPQWLAEDRGLV